VRLYPLRRGDWKGDRLAVLPEARHGALGAQLVRFAVATARAARRSAHGGHDPAAQRRVLRGLGWHRDGAAVAFHGRPHQPMAIALSADA
jgi:GNAT superfamily N-acetyltransferase